MTFSLYNSPPVTSVAVPTATGIPSTLSTETLFNQLDNHLRAYDSVQTVYSEIAAESLTFVDTKNVVLFNEYMRQLQHNFGIAPQTVSPVALESMSGITVNYELSLEGWMGDMWKKIKTFFAKIYQSIKDFMAKHLTRLGRLKNKLNNIQTVAKESTKDLAQAQMNEVPSGLASKFKGFDSISESVVLKLSKTTTVMVAELQQISAAGADAAKNGILDSNFITEIKKLKEVALNATKQIEANKEQKSKLGVFKDRKERSQINEDNKTLTEVSKAAQDNADQGDADVVQAGVDGGDPESDQDKKGQDIYKKYLKTVVDSLDKFKGEKMVGGKTVSKVEVSSDNELTVEFDEEGEPAENITLTNKEGVKNLCSQALEMIEAAEKQSESFAKTNDEIMKQLQAVDNLIADIDRNAPERYGKYRAVLDKKIRTRLNMMKVLFRSYNQVGKNFFDISLLTGDVVVDYCVICLKNFK